MTRMSIEVWLHGFPTPRPTVDLATRAEAWGFDGLLLPPGCVGGTTAKP